jgi:4-hydroxybenzoate polyprenyltransferase
MIAAGGYVINDYFDVKIDKVNKPDRMVIDKGVKRRVAMGAHTVISILAVIIGLYVSWVIGHWKLVFIHFICATGLWFYSTTFKRQFLIGNIVIALFTAIVPLVVGVFELLPCYKEYLPVDESLSFMLIWKWVLGLSFFAFITTLLREILKDIEDYEGDKEYGCKTMPIVIGIKSTKVVASIIAVATMVCLGYLQMLQYIQQDWIGIYYVTIALQFPFAFLIYKILTANTKKEFRFAGNTAKFIMLMGVCYLIVFNYFLFK